MKNFYIPWDGGVYHLQVSNFGNVKSIAIIFKDGTVMEALDIAFEFQNAMDYASDCLPLWQGIYSSLNRKTKKKVNFSFTAEVPSNNGKAMNKWLIHLSVKADGSNWTISKSFNNDQISEDALVSKFFMYYSGDLATTEYLKKITSKVPSRK